MIDDIRVIDIDQKYRRAIAVARVGTELVVCLAIRRYYSNANREHYWCFYIGLKEAQFQHLRRTIEEGDQISYLGIAGDSINVPKALCDAFLVEQPMYYAGIHVNRTVLGNESSEEIVSFLSVFVESVLEKMVNHNET